MLRALSKVSFLCGGEALALLLDELVDMVPYTRCQLLRGPYACKLQDSRLLSETSFQLQPGWPFEKDPLTAFASYASLAHALDLPTLSKLCGKNQALQRVEERCPRRSIHKVLAPGLKTAAPSNSDMNVLYIDCFRKSVE